jgi:PAS domain S-box-containing protein
MTTQQIENGTTRASLELLYHVSRELTSALDLRTVLQRVIFLSMQYVGAISGSIIVLDDNEKPIESAMIVRDQVHDHTTQQLHVTLDQGLAGWVVRNREAALVIDTTQDERWIRRQYDVTERTGPKSAVSAPLMARELLVGVMTLVHPSPNFFTSDHVDLVQAIADQAGIAVLNAKLYNESLHQARVMTALAESAGAITGSLNLDDVLSEIMEQISQAFDVEGVSLALIEPEQQTLVVQAATGWKNEIAPGKKINLGQGVVGWVAQEDEGLVITDVHQDGRYDEETGTRTGLKTQAIACAPIRYRGEVIGALEVINPKQGEFDPDALPVLTGIGSLAGTAIRHAQLFERLQAAHQSYRELFEDSIDPILVTNWDGDILEVNRKAEQATDYDKDYLRDMTINQLHTIDTVLVGENLENLPSGETFSYESRLRTRSGHELPIEVYVREVKIDDVPRIQWILRDVTERKNLDLMRDDLISMIYHDLRSPLANVVSSLDVMDTLLPVEDDTTFKSLLDIAMRSTERIQRLTDSLLDINRLEVGQPIGNRHSVDTITIIEEAIDSVKPFIDSKEHLVETEVPPELPKVFVDQDMIRRVLTNLLENAAKYSPSRSEIRVGAKQEGIWIYIWVQDNGTGIPASEHERIFDKFSRLDAGKAPKGLGLGLAYCRLAVRGHGGRIWVESEPGSGACFTFTLPIENRGD